MSSNKNPWIYLSVVLLIIVAYLIGRSEKQSLFEGLLKKATPTTIPTKIIFHDDPTNTPLKETKNIPTQIPANKTNYIAPTTDPDPPVHCKIGDKCGGGTIPLKQSECRNTVCCHLLNGSYVFYKDINQSPCKESSSPQQSNTQQNNQSSDIKVTLPSDSLDYKNCILNQQFKQSSCSGLCDSKLRDGKWACDDEFYPLTLQNSDAHGACYRDASAAHTSCYSKCSNQYSIDIQQCH